MDTKITSFLIHFLKCQVVVKFPFTSFFFMFFARNCSLFDREFDLSYFFFKSIGSPFSNLRNNFGSGSDFKTPKI